MDFDFFLLFSLVWWWSLFFFKEIQCPRQEWTKEGRTIDVKIDLSLKPSVAASTGLSLSFLAPKHETTRKNECIFVIFSLQEMHSQRWERAIAGEIDRVDYCQRERERKKRISKKKRKKRRHFASNLSHG